MSETAKTEAQPAARTLVKKLAQVMGEVERVAKNGRNQSQGYQYATEADIAAAVRVEMAKRFLMLIPSVQKMDWGEVPTKSGNPLKLCTLTVEFTLEDGESGETRKYVIIGQGTDNGDKATYKAMTGAEKYALMKLFLIPTGDDPEKDDAVAEQRQAAKQSSPAPAQRELTEGERIAAEPGPDERQDVSGGTWGPTIKFGKSKGKFASELERKDLAFYVKCARESLNDPEKAKFHTANREMLQDLLDVARSKGWAE